MARAGEVHSIRLPAGTASRLREVTNETVSATARKLLLAYIEAAEQQKAKQA